MSQASAGAQDASARDRHLFGPGRKRILSISGGGVRGVLALAILEKLEAVLGEAAGGPVRLCDHFDLVGGTSTGAIIATAIALGYSVKEIKEFYFTLGPRVFRRSYFRLLGWQARFDAKALRAELIGIIGARTLDSPDLQTGLGVMLKRVDAGSAWILTNNPRSRFWESPADGGYIGNRHYPLASVVRASTAAPTFFDPQDISIVEGAPPALFVDGGLTPHNDPSLALLLAAVQPCYGVAWPMGVDQLTLVSIGTGSFRDRVKAAELRRASAVGVALRSLVQQISDNQQLTLTLMSWLGRGGAPWPINEEIGDMADQDPPFGPLFRYLRYDALLEDSWLSSALGITTTPNEMAQLRRFDNPDVIPQLYEIGRRAADLQLKPADIVGA